MSYGEPSKLPGQGKFVEMLAEAVNKHNILFITSAGNSGPALCTTCAPAGTESCTIGVGAYVTEEMQRAQYMLRENVPDTHFTWSSRGPSMDGEIGVSISAPGGAIAPVPQWTLQKSEQMNGTSMAAPNACGGVALLLSALKAKGISYTSMRVRRAIENTAKEIEGVVPLTNGHGLLQVCAALEYLEENADCAAEDIHFKVRVNGHDGEEKRGIFLRDLAEVQEPSVHVVTVKPSVQGEGEDSNEKRVAMDLKLSLSCSAEWVRVPSHIFLANCSRQFAVEVDPTLVTPNSLHFTEILARDCDRPDAGPLFRVAVTLTKPREVNGSVPVVQSLALKPSSISRSFFSVPAHANWAEVRLRSSYMPSGPRIFMLHAMLRRPHMSYRDVHAKTVVRMQQTNQRKTLAFAVRPGNTLELCIAQYWSSLGDSTLEVEVQFHGIVTDSTALLLSNARPVAGVEVGTFLHREELKPSCQFTTIVRQLSPKARGTPEPLMDPRNSLPSSRRLHQLVLEYSFEAKEAGLVVTPKLPGVHGLLYENRIQGQLYMLFDEAKQLLGTGDAYDEKHTLRTKGKYTIRLQLSSDSSAELEQLAEAQLELWINMPSPMTLQVLGQPQDHLAADATPVSSICLCPGGHRRIYVALPNDASKFPSLACAGDVLTGSLTLVKREGVSVIKAGYPQITVSCSLVHLPKKKESAAAAAKTRAANVDKKKGLTPMDRLRLQQKEAFLTEYKGLPFKTAEERKTAAQFAAEGVTAFGISKDSVEYVELLRATLASCKGLSDDDVLVLKRKTVTDLEDSCPAAELREYFSHHYDKETMSMAEKVLHQDKEQRKEALLDALLAGAELHSSTNAEDQAMATSCLAKLRTWTDTSSGKYAAVDVADKLARGLRGLGLQAARKQVCSTDAVAERQAFLDTQQRVQRELGWSFHAAHTLHQRLLAAPPQGYTPF